GNGSICREPRMRWPPRARAFTRSRRETTWRGGSSSRTGEPGDGARSCGIAVLVLLLVHVLERRVSSTSTSTRTSTGVASRGVVNAQEDRDPPRVPSVGAAARRGAGGARVLRGRARLGGGAVAAQGRARARDPHADP